MQGRIEPPNVVPESIIVKVSPGKAILMVIPCCALDVGTEGGQTVFEITSDDPRINPADCVAIISKDARDKLIRLRRNTIENDLDDQRSARHTAN